MECAPAAVASALNGLKRGNVRGKRAREAERGRIEVGLLLQSIAACLVENSAGINAIHPAGAVLGGPAAMGA